MNVTRPFAIVFGLLLVVPILGQTAEPRSRHDTMKDFVRPASIPFPTDNVYEEQKAHLGQMLFFDPRLSGSNSIACASCHNPALSWGDGLPRGIGEGTRALGRRTPTILNLAWANLVMWDGRKTGLEDQVFGPITTPAEMNFSIAGAVGQISAINAYQAAFMRVFGDEGVSARTIPLAIATYERTIVSGKAPFDRWIEGDEAAISDESKFGFDVFTGKGNCAACHSGWNFTDNGFHDIGLKGQDIGRGEWIKIEGMQHAFKTPTLRDADRRGPYMHDGSVATLSAVIDEYDRGGIARPSLAEEIRPLHLTSIEKQQLLAFLGTLTGENSPVILPVLPNPSIVSR